MAYEGPDTQALTQDAIEDLSPGGDLRRAQATELVGICAALSEIAYYLRDDNCDSPLLHAIRTAGDLV